jgi:hypothetical protein
VLDFQPEIGCLLESWKSRGKIEGYSSVRGSEIQQTLLKVETELGPRRVARIPSRVEVKERIWSYLKDHPAQYALWLAIVSAVMGWWLSRLLK